MVMGVAIVGCGLIGNKSATAPGNATLIAVADSDIQRASDLAAGHPGCGHHLLGGGRVPRRRSSRDRLDDQRHASADHVGSGNPGKHVLVEKPAARCAAELLPVAAAAKRAGVTVKVGFNHRFHPALRKAREIFASGEFGPLMYIRARYGHGGRVGYDREWRADRAISGGGEMLDQGVHLIDLARWFAGDFVEVAGHVDTFFWNMPVEDNGFALLKTATGQVAWLHASCTEWKNLFCFEIFCRAGKLQIDGLGRSYGVERLTAYRMLPQMGPPEINTWEYPGEDTSWRDEFADFAEAIAQERPPLGTLEDAIAALRVIETLYQQSGLPSTPSLP